MGIAEHDHLQCPYGAGNDTSADEHLQERAWSLTSTSHIEALAQTDVCVVPPEKVHPRPRICEGDLVLSPHICCDIRDVLHDFAAIYTIL